MQPNAKVLEVAYDHVFEPWPVARVRAILARYRAADAEGTLDAMHGECAEFERLHPILARRLHAGLLRDPKQVRLLEVMLQTREQREQNAVTEEDAIERVTDAAFRYFKTV